VRLITAHRILILAAIAFSVFYALFNLRRWADVGGAGFVAQSAVSVLVAAGLVAYYRTLKGWGQRL
jgi:hypothetical protein